LEQITSENYVEHAINTDASYGPETMSRIVRQARLLHASMGLVTEAGELMDMLKKHFFYGKELDLVNAKEELGDAEWYIALAIDEMKTTMNEVLTLNINKLKLRYPAKFSSEDAINRNVVAERELLERKVDVVNLNSDAKEFVTAIKVKPPKPCKPSSLPYEDVLNGAITYPSTEQLADDIIAAAKDSKRVLSVDKYEPYNAFSQQNDLGFHIDEKTGGIVNEVLPTNNRQYKGIRTAEWLEFAYKVADHIENYTIPQYSDKPNDQAEGWSVEHCIEQVKKYANRFGKNQRPGQEMLDFMKGCHYLQLAATKFVEAQELTAKVEPNWDRR